MTVKIKLGRPALFEPDEVKKTRRRRKEGRTVWGFAPHDACKLFINKHLREKNQ
ncbi:MAG: hypothetical protein AB7Q00_03185 [Phycisphaerales bacterium]